jgi:hypothetical protein
MRIILLLIERGNRLNSGQRIKRRHVEEKRMEKTGNQKSREITKI